MKCLKYIKNSIKREHVIIEGILPLLEKIVNIKGVKKVIPAKIYKTNKGTNLFIKLQRKTPTGFKMMAHGKGCIQEIFVIGEYINITELENIK